MCGITGYVGEREAAPIVIEGLSEGTEVALVNPEGRQQKPSKAPAAGPIGVGGGR